MMTPPPSMSGLPRDRRGYPIPVTVAVDSEGRPHFTITDPVARHAMIQEDRCHISGRKLLRGRWFIGGPLAAFHARGAFLDGPMLDECSSFAVRTCPYIAAPRYARRIEDRTLSSGAGIATRIHEEVVTDRPELFVRLMCVGQRLVPSSDGDVLFVPKAPYRRVEFWRHGIELDFDEGVAMAVAESGGELTESDVLARCPARSAQKGATPAPASSAPTTIVGRAR